MNEMKYTKSDAIQEYREQNKATFLKVAQDLFNYKGKTESGAKTFLMNEASEMGISVYEIFLEYRSLIDLEVSEMNLEGFFDF